MIARRFRRRGLTLALVVITMAIVGSVVSLLAMYTAHAYRARQMNRAHHVTRALLNSGVAYARLHAVEWSADPPGEPAALDIDALLPAGMTGGLSLSFPRIDGRPACRISAHAKSGPAFAADKTDVVLRQ